jgi:hypothetical protein
MTSTVTQTVICWLRETLPKHPSYDQAGPEVPSPGAPALVPQSFELRGRSETMFENIPIQGISLETVNRGSISKPLVLGSYVNRIASEHNELREHRATALHQVSSSLVSPS